MDIVIGPLNLWTEQIYKIHQEWGFYFPNEYWSFQNFRDYSKLFSSKIDPCENVLIKVYLETEIWKYKNGNEAIQAKIVPDVT